jgi:TolB-like protein/Tfp pilus assembly protein PilF
MSPSLGLVAELKRRSVFKVGAAYLVVAWLAAQAAGLAFPTFEAPVWALRVFIFILALGFPIALVLAWTLEVTPEGVKLDPAPAGNKRMYAVVTGLAALAVAWFFVGAPAVRDMGAAERSIAVLPFVNMSEDPANEYFSDGIAEEILNVLAQTPGLKVAARTSSFSFKNGSKPVAEIAAELQVRMVLEGSVRKQGERVRITAQLIDARDGFHVWSQVYDRDLQDIFAIQDEIAHAIVRKLATELKGARGRASGGTQDLAAHDLYLKGLALWQARGEANLRAAVEAFSAAAARDPGFAKAWVGVALAHSILPDWSTDEPAAHLRTARDAAERALGIDPALPEAFAVLSLVAATELRFETANVLMDRALSIAPSYATAYQWYGESLVAQGRTEEAVRMAARAASLDPVSPVVHNIYGLILNMAGRNGDARRVLQQVPRDAPARFWSNQYLLGVAFEQRDADSARALMLELATKRDAATLAYIEALVGALVGKGDVAATARRLRDLPLLTPANTPVLKIQHMPRVAWFMAVGQNELALDAFAGFAARYPQYARSYALNAPMDPVRCEPRFRTMMHAFGVEDARYAAICANMTE